MAQPPSYKRQKNFADDFGNETDHPALNAELDRASNSINDIRANLAILQADDGKLRPFVVTSDSISEELRVSLVEGVVMDAQAMLDESKVALEASISAAEKAKASEAEAADSAVSAKALAKEAARSAEIAQSAINADWNATSGAAEILNKPGDFGGATADSAGEQGLVPAPGAGDQDKVLAGDGTWRHVSGVPVGTIEYFAREEMPQGYLLAAGQAVGRATYPDLFAAIGTAYGEGDGETTFNLPRLGDEIGAIVPFASLHMPQDFMPCDGQAVSRLEHAELFSVIGTTYGEGDGETTFNLPDLVGRFAEGSETPGTVKEAGLPELAGTIGSPTLVGTSHVANGVFASSKLAASPNGTNINWLQNGTGYLSQLNYRASEGNPIYGASDTVQPPALTVCYGIRVKNRLHAAIKAFDAAVDQGLVDITELANDIQKAKTPVGTVAWFAMSSPPVGYLVANGAAVGRATYPDLFAAIGTMYGEGDGETTFNLPNLIGRFAEGSETPGTVKEAGLPDLTGDITNIASGGSTTSITTGGFAITQRAFNSVQIGDINNGHTFQTNFSASRSNPIYGASDTVQPPALTLLPCIKAFDATVNTGLINVTELAQDVAGKAERSQVANLAMPSGTFVELTLPPSGSNIVAPADGYIYLDKTSTAQGQYIAVFSGGMGLSEIALQSGQILRATLPVKRGTNILPDYNAAGTTNHFRFIYAEGSQP